MAFELNKIHHSDWMNNGLPDKSVHLIIADPPYFEVKGEFDFIWKTFDEYLQQMEAWAKEFRRILADNGTLFIYGDRKVVAYVQVIFDKYFKWENHIIWKKPASFTEGFSDSLRSFPQRCFERILMYSVMAAGQTYEITGLQAVHDDNNNFKSIKDYLDAELNKSGMTTKDVNELWNNGRAGHCFGFTKKDKVQFQFLSELQYKQLQDKTGNFQKTYDDLRQEYESQRQEYESQRQEYESQRRYFNNFLRLHDCWEFTNGNPSAHEHATPKPEEMTRVMILSCSKEKDLVLIPFAGSGTECAMCAKENRNFIGFEIDERYIKASQKRTGLIQMQPNLFH